MNPFELMIALLIFGWLPLGIPAALIAGRLASRSDHDARSCALVAFVLSILPFMGWVYVAILSIAYKPVESS